jgi:hypothetical protein
MYNYLRGLDLEAMNSLTLDSVAEEELCPSSPFALVTRNVLVRELVSPLSLSGHVMWYGLAAEVMIVHV